MTEAKLLVDMVRRGYDRKGNLGPGLNWRLPEPLHSAGVVLYDCLRAVGRYNDFDPDKVTAKLVMLNCEVTVGRECSPVLYIRPLDSETSKWLITAMEAVRASEITWRRNEMGLEILRVWWD
jgi:hypothetical protein